MAKKKTTLFVSLYLWEQVYGGAEEGGWYYYARHLDTFAEIPAGRNQTSKIRQAKRLLTEYVTNYDIKDFDIVVEKDCGSHNTSRQEYC